MIVLSLSRTEWIFLKVDISNQKDCMYVCMYGEIRKENFIKLQLLLFLTLEAFSRFFCVNLTVVTIFMLCLWSVLFSCKVINIFNFVSVFLFGLAIGGTVWSKSLICVFSSTNNWLITSLNFEGSIAKLLLDTIVVLRPVIFSVFSYRGDPSLLNYALRLSHAADKQHMR